jgi:fructosamine-3-kinase
MKLETHDGSYFIKWQQGIPGDMFQKEAEGLRLIGGTGKIRVPEVIAWGKIDGKHYLLMENIESAPSSPSYWEDFGASLAVLHHQNSSDHYGLDHGNYIGKLPQPNKILESWIDFFVANRLEYQLQLAIQNGLLSSSFIDRYRNFYKLLPDLLPVDKPALLHGDLWSGNVMVGGDGKVCLIDPAVYYGHREIELAFTQLFGGFDHEFYRSYQSNYPLEAGFDQRVDIYNMYPLMVHVNLFGISYLSGVERVLRRYL